MTTIKTIIAALLVAASAPAFAQNAHAGHAKPAANTAASAATTPAGPGAVVTVNGLICDFCVQALTRTFRRQAAVSSVAVDMDAKEVRLGFKPGATLDDAAIGRLVKQAGYNVVSIARRPA